MKGDPVFSEAIDQLVTILLVIGLLYFAAALQSCAPPDSRYGFVFDIQPEAYAATQARYDAAADCLVAQLEGQGLMQPGVAAAALVGAHVMIVEYADAVPEYPGWERSGSTDGHIVYTTPTSLQHELVHVILCATQLGKCDDRHEARAWWVPVTEPAKRCAGL